MVLLIDILTTVFLLLILGSPFIILRFTFVDEGTAKIVVRFGAYHKTLLSKKGYMVREDGEIVIIPLEPAPSDFPLRGFRFIGVKQLYNLLYAYYKLTQIKLPGGLRFVGFWPLDKVYAYDFTWVKVKFDGTAENRDEKGVNFVLARDYVYGVKVLKAEDKNSLPLDVLLSATAQITNPYKWLFNVKDGFGAFVGRVSPYVRSFVAQKSYDDLEETNLEHEIFSQLAVGRKVSGTITMPGIIDTLRKSYGIHLRKIEVINIDPPPEFRETTLRQYTATQNAKAEAEETGGALDRMIDKRIDRLAERFGFDADQRRQYLKDNPDVLRRIEEQQVDLLRRDRAGPGLRDIRVGNADGSKLEPATATIMSLIEMWKSERGESKSKKRDKKKKDDDDDEDDFLIKPED
ncbi:MAG: SPFH domain-containing protein [Candidatus Staskawiczbacteria bacterium]|nr:SPFH domain-containing protein [Candidatus Staskawiczbacteria bacterium]